MLILYIITVIIYRIQENCYTSLNDKSTLIIFEGLSRLTYSSKNCALEMLRTFLETGKIISADQTIIDIKFNLVVSHNKIFY